MSVDPTHVAAPERGANDLDEKTVGLVTHPPSSERGRLVALAVVMILLASLYPLLARSSYEASSDAHATIEVVGALFSLVAGFALVVRFYTLGNRFHLLVGLAFFVNGAEDLVHGLLSYQDLQPWTGLPVSSLERFIPGTYVTGRLLLGTILFLAPPITKRFGESRNPRRETKWATSAVLVVTMMATALAFQLPLPRFVYPDSLIARPVDFLSAIVLLVALLSFLAEYRRDHDVLTWWVMLSIGVNTVGQVMMSFSKSLYDPFFVVAHVYKVFGYVIPLLGFSLYQIAIITERMQAEEALKGYSERLEEMVEERTKTLRETQEQLVRREKLAVLGQMAGSVGHELRNPLGVISNAAYFLKLTLGDADDTTKEYLEIISAEVRASEKIVSDLMDLSRTGTAGRTETAVSDLVASSLQRQPPPEGVKVSTELTPELPHVFVDSQQIGQVLANLVTNAYQAMPEGGDLSIRAREAQGRVSLSVGDTGCGIPEGDINKLFEPLFTTKARGIGLGLAVSKNLLEANGGSIEVKSEVGRGSTFTIHLPLANPRSSD